MSEAPRPPGDGTPGIPPDPTAPLPPAPGSYSSPGEPSGSGYAPPPPSAPSFEPSGGSHAAPPPGEYAPPPSGSQDAPPPGGGYGPPGGYGAPQSGPPGGYDAPPGAGYGAPPGGGYVPPGGYQPGGYAQGGAGVGTDDKMYALVAHFGGAAGAFVSLGPLGFVGPLIAYLAKGQQSPAVRAHAVAALNFQLLWSAIALVVWTFGWCLLFTPNLIVTGIQVVFGIIGGMKANEGHVYKYPMSVNFIK